MHNLVRRKVHHQDLEQKEIYEERDQKEEPDYIQGPKVLLS